MFLWVDPCLFEVVSSIDIKERDNCFYVTRKNQALHEPALDFSEKFIKCNHIDIPLSGTDQCNSNLSKNGFAGKGNSRSFLIFEKICQQIKVQR